MRLTPVVALAVLAGTLYVGARPAGPLPALGPLLDPAHGLWSAARAKPVPAGEATIAIPGLGGRVRVVYDRRAVPHIFADREEDAYRALGYVVARDRLFQMYVQTLAGSGRLTELGGARLLGADRETRHLGLPWSADRKLKMIQQSPESRGNAQAYADGVNAYVASLAPGDVPMEFRLLNRTPPRWQPIDAVHLLNRMGYTLAVIDPEMDRAAAAARVGRTAAAALFPETAPIVEPIQPNGQTAPRFDFAPLPPPGAPDTGAATLAGLLDVMPTRLARRLARGDEPPSMASNNWAVAPRRTASGHALLAGDPHLELTLPSIWYEAHLVVPDKLDVYGVTIPGAPGIVIGFNRDVAWTFTNTGADVIDYYAERVDDDARPTKYLLDGQWRPLERRVEQYRGPDGAVVATDTLYFTHRGPMERRRGRWLSMRWTVLEASDEAAGFRDAARARTVAEWQAAMSSHYWAPAQNMLTADRHGAIAIRSTGHFPIRPGDGSGLSVRDGTVSASDWQGWLPLDRYPQSFDPPQGFLASANQQPIDPRQVPGYFGGDFDPWRALRINALLRADSQVTPDAMRRYQTDPGSARADYFAPFFLALHARPGVDSARLAEAVRLLGQWDRRYTLDNTRAVLFELAMRELSLRTWDELDDPTRPPVKSAGAFGEPSTAPPRAVNVSTAVLAELLADSASIWWDVRATQDRAEHRDDVLAASLVAALDSAQRKFGAPDAGGWTWSRVRHANVKHLLQIPALGALDLSVPSGPSTLAPSSGSGTHGPSWRMVVELGPEVHAMAIYPGGQSGNPMSPHYKDRLPRWLAGQLDTLYVPRTAGDVDAAHTAGVLTLVPPAK
ncbi:MAG: penicillin acylase family protein [Gemmatirosa sp.]|nr:penicillin acylase family protein [Gemmatirosa sp.]